MGHVGKVADCINIHGDAAIGISWPQEPEFLARIDCEGLEKEVEVSEERLGYVHETVVLGHAFQDELTVLEEGVREIMETHVFTDLKVAVDFALDEGGATDILVFLQFFR